MRYQNIPALKLFLCAGLCMTAAGCAAGVLVAVGAGAVGGYAVSRDTFEGVTNKTPEELWDASNHIASIMGAVTDSDRRSNQVSALINGAKVTINVLPVNLTTTKLRIKARKNIFPAVAIAQDVYSKIINQLEEK